ncbi:DnaT-like ssDNA-binding protein [Delftia lacustris]|uniref:DnaT-like ssDNA-binding protein n=1 Tax=Delftia lacustris TaxID=558537 RepID=UPI0006404052|nr:DnaT-like ssDNA-binding protein [Delftia lacustris]
MAAYGTDDGLQAWLTAQGLTLPVGAVPATLRAIGSAYVDAAYEARLQCSHRAGGFAQELAWPRAGHRVNGQPVPEDLIPPAWINASYRAAYLEAITPGWATGSSDPNRITRREQVDTISREFFAPGDTGGGAAAPGMASDAIINGMVLPWLCSSKRRADTLFRVI